MALRDKAFTTAASARARSLNQWPLLVVVAGELIGLGLLWIGHWRWGSVVIGLSLLLGAAERLVLAPRVAGLLQVRTRTFDVLTLAAMGAAIVLLALVVPSLR